MPVLRVVLSSAFPYQVPPQPLSRVCSASRLVSLKRTLRKLDMSGNQGISASGWSALLSGLADGSVEEFVVEVS